MVFTCVLVLLAGKAQATLKQYSAASSILIYSNRRVQEEMARRANKRTMAQKSTDSECGKFSSKYVARQTGLREVRNALISVTGGNVRKTRVISAAI